eukprot:TRINITY_DN25116_c0_g1_i1.p1 TRINITY_DN25116_c0_g1~~TRINITY_DN25116_c0_g1_i1.p1  ORF type:complete len:155 (-),score=14.83 TRINITY_DN25116_c0_g1_i1:316-780(-)
MAPKNAPAKSEGHAASKKKSGASATPQTKRKNQSVVPTMLIGLLGMSAVWLKYAYRCVLVPPHYRELQVCRVDDEGDIRRAFDRLTQVRTSSLERKRLQEAFDVLSDPKRREKYDTDNRGPVFSFGQKLGDDTDAYHDLPNAGEAADKSKNTEL